MNDIIETHYYGGNKRILVQYDTDASNPRDDDPDFVGMFPMNTYSGYVVFAPGKRDAMWLYLESAAQRFGPDSDEFVDDVTQFFANLEIPFIIHEFSSNRHPIGKYVVYAHDPETTTRSVRAYLDNLDRWLNGEVYVLTLQTKHTYVSVDDPEKFVEVWEDEYGDTIGGNYIQNVSDPLEVGEFFDELLPVDMEVDLYVD